MLAGEIEIKRLISSTMGIRILILSAVVSAGRVSQNFRDHHLAQPKTDFGAFEENVGFEEGRPFRQMGPESDRHYEHSEFQTQFNHREFHQNSDGEKKDFGFKGRNFGEETRGDDSLRRELDFKSYENPFFRRNEKDPAIGNRETGRSFNHRHDSVDSNRNFATSQHEFENKFGSNNFNHNFQGRRIDNRNYDTNRFSQESGTQIKNQYEGLGESTNFQTQFRDRADNSRNIDSQRVKHKEEFEIISNDNERKFNSENRRQNTEDDRTSSRHEHDTYDTQEGLRTNINSESIPTRNSNNRPNQHNRNTASNTDTNPNLNTRTNRTTEIKTTTENEIPHKVNKTEDSDGNRTLRQDEDMWVWGVEEGKKKTTTEVAATVTLDDRASFTGSKCPNGKVKINDTCVEVD